MCFFAFSGPKIRPAAADTGELGWDLRDPTPAQLESGRARPAVTSGLNPRRYHSFALAKFSREHANDGPNNYDARHDRVSLWSSAVCCDG